ncbi:glycoside hydrolase family 2 protein [Microbacterium luticocti]|uniref:glycoside hydrolase family 2 protein n=1 Tax=Microbacterium luticocti TaxID=451764 RepID=UPI000421EE15|nr:glycoside hydrolase family 2 TIM barrel-domain containing protein [Microbacterium luticocti]
MSLVTPWGEAMDATAPLPEYPRPQLVRNRWQNLNGVWDYAITPFDAGALGHDDRPAGDDPFAAAADPLGTGDDPLAAGDDPLAVADPTHPPHTWDGEIVVPFSPETALSGVGRTLQSHETLWYRRSFTADPGEGERVILHLGAVDQSCRIAVDGVEVASHTGGYLPVVVDITAALAGRAGDGEHTGNERVEQAEQEQAEQERATQAEHKRTGQAEQERAEQAERGRTEPADRGAHEIVVAVRDVTDASWPARGKQSTRRGGIWYTPQSGIWQTVWLEILPRVAVDRLSLTPYLGQSESQGEIEIEIEIGSDHAEPGTEASVVVRAEGQVVASVAVPVGTPARVALGADVRPWSPEDPFLYDVEVALGDDVVTSYVGMRSLGVGRDGRGVPRLLLNGRPYLPVGLLDQGYWPDGGYTAPSDAALEYDIRLAKRLGYTMLRKHIKVEPLRWYHHCDRLGMLVWQDAVNGGERYRPWVITAPAFGAPALDDARHAAFGRSDPRGRARFERELAELVGHLRSVPSVALWVPFNEGWGQFDAARIAHLVRRLDPTRPVDHASGWHDQGAGDLRSLHVYFRPVRAPRRRDDRVLAITEYGGYSLAVPAHTWGSRTFGYRRYRSRRRLQDAIVRLHEREIAPAVRRGVAALVYTQLSDVEDEVNGLVTYDRRFVKVDVDVIRAMNDRLREEANA